MISVKSFIINQRLSFCSFVLLSAAVGLAPQARGASVTPSGYTNDFSTQPTAADWSTLSIGTGAATITTAAGLDAAVQGVAAGSVTSPVGTGVNEPPDLNASAQWAP